MTPPPRRTNRPTNHRGLTNGNGIVARRGRASGPGLTNGRGATNGLTNGLGRTNGLTNGLGRVNGLTNGLGRTNGLTNGLGRVNGTGAINGLINGSHRRRLRQNPFGVITQRDLRVGLGLVVLTLLLLGPLYLLLSTPPPAPLTRIAVDGALGDWAGIDFLEDSVASPNGDVSLRAYSAVEENGYLSFGVRVGGLSLGDTTPSGLDGVYVFIDADGNPLTGYAAREIGAEFVVSVQGRTNAVTVADLLEFRGGSPTNWSEWRKVEPVRAAASGNELEIQIAPDAVPLGTRHAFLVHTDDYAGNETTASVHFDLSRRALLVAQDAADPVVAQSGDPFARLSLTAFGGPANIASLAMTKLSGPGTLSSLGDTLVLEGDTGTADVAISFGPGDATSLVIARVEPSGISTAEEIPVTVDGPDVVAYLVAAPGGHRVDGYFGEWTQLGYDPTPTPNRDVDVLQYAANRTGADAFVYADVVGRIFRGSGSPERFAVAAGGGGGPPGPPSPGRLKTGEDLFRAYVDVDALQPSGTMALGILADYVVEVRGVHGRITSARTYEWSGGQWTPSTRGVSAANGRSALEARLDLFGVVTGDMRMAVESSDWRGGVDSTDVYSFTAVPGGEGTRGSDPPVVLNADSPQEITATGLTAQPTVNGACSDAEYSDVGGTKQDLSNLTLYVGMYSDYLYVCAIVKWDTNNNAADYGAIMFDRAHDGGTTPQTDDRMFWVNMSSSDLWDFKGDGSDWVDCLSSCQAGEEAGGGFDGTNPNYEFKIHRLDVVVSGNMTAGFGFLGFNAANATYVRWGSTTQQVTISNPNSWGHITIPEFRDLVGTAAVVGIIYLVARRRRRDPDP